MRRSTRTLTVGGSDRLEACPTGRLDRMPLVANNRLMHTLPPDSQLRPELRYGLAAEPHGKADFALHDPLGIGRTVVLSPMAIEVAERFDGQSTCAEIAAALMVVFPGATVSADVVAGLAAGL